MTSFQEGHIWIVATVVNLLLEKEWSYLGCKRCSKKVDKIGSKFHCKKCDRLDSFGTHRYKLRVQVMDHTGFINLLLWDREATTLIGKSANQLNEISIEASADVDECSYPVELYDILDKKVLFKSDCQELKTLKCIKKFIMLLKI
ncbi:PREDICTED: replication factor A protein 1-like [Nicotiana attenuata]|uniref:replication factor A protein 1-like n=1 Tax=Nicotiana attenuata TaxID=49451 RepID=UPI000904D41F|nr:PREDICTED: replication factor A protein 1-like [Nicotiana attenuata]